MRFGRRKCQRYPVIELVFYESGRGSPVRPDRRTQNIFFPAFMLQTKGIHCLHSQLKWFELKTHQ